MGRGIGESGRAKQGSALADVFRCAAAAGLAGAGALVFGTAELWGPVLGMSKFGIEDSTGLFAFVCVGMTAYSTLTAAIHYISYRRARRQGAGEPPDALKP